MAYHEGPVDQVRARIRSTRGETIDLALPDTCTVGELRSFLIEEYQYNPNTRLLFNSAPADDTATVTSFPYGSLLIATPSDMTELARQQPQAAPQAGARGGSPGQPSTTQQQTRNAPMANESPGKQTRIPQHQSHMAAQLHRNHAQAETAGVSHPPNRRRSGSTEESKAGDPSQRAGQAATHVPAQRPAAKAAAPNPHQSSLPRRRGSTPSVGENAPPQSFQPPSTQQPASQPGIPQEQAAESESNEPVQQQAQPHVSPQATQVPRDAPESSYAQQPATFAAPPPPPQQQQQQQQQPTPRGAAPADVAPPQQSESVGSAVEFAHWREISLKLECVVPALERVVELAVTADCSVAALAVAVAGAVPDLRGTPFQLVLRGKVLEQAESNILFKIGVRSDCRMYVASGNFSSIDAIVLLEIKEKVTTIEEELKRPRTDAERKGYYEELMRMLLRTDGLQDLEGEWRASRKATVAQIVRLQDSLRVQEGS